ncbi:hypothetical protein BJ508DRAFT_327900 [Ascobolus immersus RN42]|uniref:Uncharacterized protein n=1 Tax=Ascobolus immersus RN42 TaxID=1160509 RepID=A0A3N4I320_ASCIM|nr:hypothetical protein BJ508DRAFT_327900 [Ascobolus immersus RN42]
MSKRIPWEVLECYDSEKTDDDQGTRKKRCVEITSLDHTQHHLHPSSDPANSESDIHQEETETPHTKSLKTTASTFIFGSNNHEESEASVFSFGDNSNLQTPFNPFPSQTTLDESEPVQVSIEEASKLAEKHTAIPSESVCPVFPARRWDKLYLESKLEQVLLFLPPQTTAQRLRAFLFEAFKLGSEQYSLDEMELWAAGEVPDFDLPRRLMYIPNTSADVCKIPVDQRWWHLSSIPTVRLCDRNASSYKLQCKVTNILDRIRSGERWTFIIRHPDYYSLSDLFGPRYRIPASLGVLGNLEGTRKQFLLDQLQEPLFRQISYDGLCYDSFFAFTHHPRKPKLTMADFKAACEVSLGGHRLKKYKHGDKGILEKRMDEAWFFHIELTADEAGWASQSASEYLAAKILELVVPKNGPSVEEIMMRYCGILPLLGDIFRSMERYDEFHSRREVAVGKDRKRKLKRERLCDLGVDRFLYFLVDGLEELKDPKVICELMEALGYFTVNGRHGIVCFQGEDSTAIREAYEQRLDSSHISLVELCEDTGTKMWDFDCLSD